MKEKFLEIYNKFKIYSSKYIKPITTNSIFIWIISSFILTFLVEKISNPYTDTLYQSQPYASWCFIYNLAIIMVTTCFMFLFKRRVFFFTIISSIWIGLSIGNISMLKLRGTPLTGSDVKMVKSGISIIDQYLSKAQIYLLIVTIIVFALALILLFIKAPKKANIKYKRVIPTISLFLISFVLFGKIMHTSGVVSTNFWDMVSSYELYGFPYSFSNTVTNYGVSKPSWYSESNVDDIILAVNSDTIASTESISSEHLPYTDLSDENPNIIFVQLESFFDPTLVNELSFSTDPIPYFRQLSENYTSGLLDVAVIGGGTSNTEFEVLTGLSINFFGPGEYPYNTYLKDNTAESLAYYLKEQGYSTSAMHNHFGTFYGRNNAFANLGFDRFISREDMNITSYTPIGWPKDDILITEITDLITSTTEKDFVFTVSVQGHGSYPGSNWLEEVPIEISSNYFSEEDVSKWEYYCAQINEMDSFVNNLINAVDELGEDSVIVFYGDHLPSLGLTNENMSTKNIYQTPFLIWDNIGLEKDSLDLATYQLSAYLLDNLNIEGGVVSSLHQTLLNYDTDVYLQALQTIQYDILYGKKYSYYGSDLYKKTDIKYGFRPITINSIDFDGTSYIITGDNFTEWSGIYINDSKIESTFVDTNTIFIDESSLKDNDTVIVRQTDQSGNTLASSDKFTFN